MSSTRTIIDRYRRTPVVVLMSGLLILGIAGVAGAATYTRQIDENGFNVCIEKTTKVVRYTALCTTNEALRFWKGQGPVGVAGAAGADGVDGAEGPAGLTAPRAPTVLRVPRAMSDRRARRVPVP